MEQLKEKAEILSENVTDYIHTFYKLGVLNATDKATGVTASVAAGVIVLLLGIFVMMFSGIALGLWLGNLVENAALGYLLVAGLYLLVMVVLVLLRKKIIFPMIRNLIIGKLYE